MAERLEAVAEPGVRQATAADAAGIEATLAAAFHEDPIMRWLLPDAAARPVRLRRFFRIELRRMILRRGRAWTTSDGSGAALVLPPGAWRVPLHATLLEGAAFWANVARATRLGAAMEWRHPREVRGPHWYVRDVGVVPEAQGRGLGSALLAPTLEHCDHEHLPIYLEATTERSAALYERLGFAHLGELRVGGSPPLWLMLRAPG